MSQKKIRRIALAAALATTVFAGTPQFSFAQTASETFATLASQVRAFDFGASRATIRHLQDLGFTAVRIGSDQISLQDLLAMINSAAGRASDPIQLAGYFDSLASDTADALFISDNPAARGDNPSLEAGRHHSFPIGSNG
jgi:hypothetical protein